MLAADKLQLQSQLKQQAVRLKEKEFTLHHENLMTVGTQAAVLAGLDITMLIEFQPTPLHEWHEEHQWVARGLHVMYYTLITAAFGCNMRVVAQTTALSVLGAGLALRGPDGSMGVATDCLYGERRKVFSTFAAGLGLTVGSLMVAVWLVLQWEAAFVCWLVSIFTARAIWSNYHRIKTKLEFDERETVDFGDLMNSGPVLAPEYLAKQFRDKLMPRSWRRSDSAGGDRSNPKNRSYRGPQPPSITTNGGSSSHHHSYYRSNSNSRHSSDHDPGNNSSYHDSDSSYGSYSTAGEDVEMAQNRRFLDNGDDDDDHHHHHHHHRRSSRRRHDGRRGGGGRSTSGGGSRHQKSSSPKIQTV